MASDPPFRRICVVGVGLIGGSILQAAKQAWPSIDVTGIDVQDDLVRVAGAELVILAAPVRTNIGLLEELPAQVSAGAVVTDTGSTKRAIVEAAASLPSLTFIGGHPMAGAARGGAANARPDLFQGRPWVLTPRSDDPPDAVARLESLVIGLGAVPHVMTPELHDRFVGAVSHLTASALMHVVGKLAGDAGLEIAGPGLIDTTRLATSPPDIWKDVAATNEDVLRDALDALIRALTDLRDGLETGEAIDAVFTSACRWRTSLDRR
jgi:prephenate dehydrogenase